MPRLSGRFTIRRFAAWAFAIVIICTLAESRLVAESPARAANDSVAFSVGSGPNCPESLKNPSAISAETCNLPAVDSSDLGSKSSRKKVTLASNHPALEARRGSQNRPIKSLRRISSMLLGMEGGQEIAEAKRPSAVKAEQAASTSPDLAAALGIAFVQGSTSSLILKRDGKKYRVDLVAHTVTEIIPAATSAPAESLRQDPKPAPAQQVATASRQQEKVRRIYIPGDDFLFSLPTGRRLDRHGLYVNFSHRFALDPAFSGPARGGILLGLDGFSLSSFGLRYGVTKKLFVGIYRSPTFIGRPIELMAGYNFMDERDKQPLNGVFRVSVDGLNNFSRSFTENLEVEFSRSVYGRSQFYVVPTISFNDRRLPFPSNFFSSDIPSYPGYTSFSVGVGASVDIRPSVALVAEVIPTISGGRNLGIHRPAYAFGIQKKIWRHAFTLGFTNSPGTIVSQRSGTRAAYLGDPSADTPSGLTIGFDLTRQLF